MRRQLLAAAALLLFPMARPAGAAALMADLSSDTITIGGGFTGASVVLFGATSGSGDIIAVVRGPPREVTVRRKRKIAGIWVNAQSLPFFQIPGFYEVAASRPLDELLPAGELSRHRIGVGNLQPEAGRQATPAEARRFAQALIADQERAGLFAARVGNITFLDNRLFRTELTFPADVPTGIYRVRVLLVRNDRVVAEQTIPLDVYTTGINAALSDFADRHPAAYGVVAVAAALLAGWLVSLPLRTS